MISTSCAEPSGPAETAEGAVMTLNLRGFRDSSKAAASGNKPGLSCRRVNSPLALVKTTSSPIGTATPARGTPLASRTCPRTTYFGMFASSPAPLLARELGVPLLALVLRGKEAMADSGLGCCGGIGWDE